MDPIVYIKLLNTLPYVKPRLARGDAFIRTYFERMPMWET